MEMTVEALLEETKTLYDYLDKNVELFQKISRRVFDDMNSENFIDKYKSDAYIEQEARRRLGVVEEGEVAFRILDPEITSGDSVTTDEQAEAESRNWHEVLWDSIAEAPDPEATNYSPGEQTPAEETPAGGAPADGTSTDGATEDDDSNGGSPEEGSPAGDGNQEGDAPVGNVVEEEPDAPDPVGEMPPGEVPSGQ